MRPVRAAENHYIIIYNRRNWFHKLPALLHVPLLCLTSATSDVWLHPLLPPLLVLLLRRDASICLVGEAFQCSTVHCHCHCLLLWGLWGLTGLHRSRRRVEVEVVRLTDWLVICGICKLLLLLRQLLSFINYDKSLRMRGQRRRQRRAAIFINFCKSAVCPSSSAPARLRLRTTPRPL